jgi:hypothetical protein
MFESAMPPVGWVLVVASKLVAGRLFRLVVSPAGHVSASKLIACEMFKPAMPPAGHFSLREEK